MESIDLNVLERSLKENHEEIDYLTLKNDILTVQFKNGRRVVFDKISNKLVDGSLEDFIKEQVAVYCKHVDDFDKVKKLAEEGVLSVRPVGSPVRAVTDGTVMHATSSHAGKDTEPTWFERFKNWFTRKFSKYPDIKDKKDLPAMMDGVVLEGVEPGDVVETKGFDSKGRPIFGKVKK